MKAVERRGDVSWEQQVDGGGGRRRRLGGLLAASLSIARLGSHSAVRLFRHVADRRRKSPEVVEREGARAEPIARPDATKIHDTRQVYGADIDYTVCTLYRILASSSAAAAATATTLLVRAHSAPARLRGKVLTR